MGEADDLLDVLIVGGGFSGLSAARSLTDSGVNFRLVDSFPGHLGGRAFSYDARVPEGTALRFDHGAQYVGDLQNAIMAQITELLPADQLVNGAQLRKPYPDEVMVLNQERMVFKSSQTLFGIPGVPPQLGVVGALQMIALLAEMTVIEWCIDIVEPWKGPKALLALDQISTWDWVNDKWWVSPTVADLVRISVEALLSVEPQEISPYYLLWYTACNDGFLNEINDNEGGPQQYWLLRGTDELADQFAQPVKDKIDQGVSVAEIDLSGDIVKATLQDGSVIHAKKVLVAASPATVGRRIAFTPPLPEARQTLCTQPMGRTLKCQIFYRTDWWHRAAHGKKYDGYVGGADYPVLWVMDNSPPGASENGEGPHVLMTFTVGTQLDQLGPNPTHDSVVAWVTTALRDLFADERALASSPEFIRLDSYVWDPSESDVGGGPNTIFTPGVLTGEAARLMNEPWDDKVFFASAENCLHPSPRSKHAHYDPFATQNLPQYSGEGVRLQEPKAPFYSRYSDRRQSLGYMDGAMHSGRYAAQCIAKSLGLEHSLPEPPIPMAERPTLPPDAPHDHADVLTVVKGLGSAVARLTRDELESFAARELSCGRGGQASWIRDKVLELLIGHGQLQADDHPIEQLATFRNFVIGLVDATKNAPESLADELSSEIASLEDTLSLLF